MSNPATSNMSSKLTDRLKDSGLLLIVGCMAGTGKSSKQPFGMVSILQMRSTPGIGWEGQTVFCEPELLSAFRGPGLYKVSWDVQVRQGAGSARLAEMVFDVPVTIGV